MATECRKYAIQRSDGRYWHNCPYPLTDGDEWKHFPYTVFDDMWKASKVSKSLDMGDEILAVVVVR